MDVINNQRSEVITMAIVDDEFPYRRGLKAILGLFCDQMEIIAEAGSTQDAIAIVQKQVPDIMLIDLRIPPVRGGDVTPRAEHGIAAIRQIRAIAPSVRILVLSHKEDPPILYAALRAGAHGYIAKRDLHHDDNGVRLAGIIRDVTAGDVFFGPAIAKLISSALVSERDLD